MSLRGSRLPVVSQGGGRNECGWVPWTWQGPVPVREYNRDTRGSDTLVPAARTWAVAGVTIPVFQLPICHLVLIERPADKAIYLGLKPRCLWN